MLASKRQDLKSFSTRSALALSCGAPSWLGPEEKDLILLPISFALSAESNLASSARCWLAAAGVKPSIVPAACAVKLAQSPNATKAVKASIVLSMGTLLGGRFDEV